MRYKIGVLLRTRRLLYTVYRHNLHPIMDTLTNTLTPTETKLLDMLRENTGTHFLDSGGDNGRAWQRNADTDLVNAPAVTLDDEVLCVDVFHYLKHVLDIDSSECDTVNAKIASKGLEWPQKLFKGDGKNQRLRKSLAKCFEPFDEVTVHDVVNTYNGECTLSQTLLYQVFCFDSDEDRVYIALSIHGGADVRDGYTNPVVFHLNGYLDHCPDVNGTVNGRDVSSRESRYKLEYIDLGTGCAIDDTDDVTTDDGDGGELPYDLDVYTDGLDDLLYVYTS